MERLALICNDRGALRKEHFMSQLLRGEARITFDEETETCSIEPTR